MKTGLPRPQPLLVGMITAAILMRHLLLARQREQLGQRIEHARELQPPQDGFRIGLITSSVVVIGTLLLRKPHGTAVCIARRDGGSGRGE